MNTINFATRTYVKEFLKYFRYKRVYSKFRQFTMVQEREYIDCMDLVARARDIKGAVIECGVWRGGSIAGISHILGNDRNYYLVDRFEGLPPAKEIHGGEADEYQKNSESPHYHYKCSAEEA